MNVKVQELTAEAFAPYGTFINVHDGFSNETISFQADRMLHYIGAPALDSLSTIRIRPRPLQLTVTEYHNDTEEVFGGYAADMLFHVALLGADNKPDLDTLAVFRMPAGTFCRVKRRVLHHAPFTLGDQAEDGIVLLSPAAYTIDCHVLDFDAPISIIY
ncbi:MAG: hypothetical protein HFF17_01425 [Oscillospiraceae bacterium]|nr:hypothetical protein [Oscillospiraceae bacterium]